MVSTKNRREEFRGQVVIVTGAAKGIGKATALAFSQEGAIVVLVDVLEKEMARVLGLIKKRKRSGLAVCADVSDESQIQEVIQKTLKQFKTIDILVNNAGIVGPGGPAIQLEEKDWDRVFQINLKSVFLFCKQVVPIMIKNKKGNIVNVASIAGKESSAQLCAYSASKAGVISFTRVLAKELALTGIRVNSLAPSLVATGLLSSLSQKFLDQSLARVPMKRLGRPEEVADSILFLASNKSSFITGQCLNLTGGRGEY
ncbi:MAG: SDR family NAD(P)-dependent oxidoreductase [Thermodesulfobacteriota bacterium]